MGEPDDSSPPSPPPATPPPASRPAGSRAKHPQRHHEMSRCASSLKPLVHRTSLHRAVASGCPREVRELLDAGCQPNYCRDAEGRSPLHIACLSEAHLEIAGALLEHEADVEASDVEGRTPLINAVRSGSRSVVELLLRYGCFVDRRNRIGLTALFYACELQNIDLVRLLLEHGAKPELHDHRGLSPLHIVAGAARQRSSELSGRVREAIAELLLEHGAQVNKGDADNSTPLHVAAELKDLRLMKVLLHYGANVNARDDYGNAPIHLAIHTSHPLDSSRSDLRAIELLIERGADIEVKNNESKSPLHCACENGCQQMIELLVNRGANTLAECTAFNCCPGFSLQFLRDAQFTALLIVVAKGFPHVVEFLLQHPRVGVRTPSPKVPNPLFFSVFNRDFETSRSLLWHGTPTENSGFSLDVPIIHLACVLQVERIVDLLVCFGADYCRDKANRIFYQIASGGQVTDCIDGIRFLTLPPNASMFLGKRLVRLVSYSLACRRNLTHKGDLELIDSIPELKEHRANCERELARMRADVLWEHWSVFTILEKDLHIVAEGLGRYRGFAEALTARIDRKAFPIYHAMLELKFELALERRGYLDLAENLVLEFFKPALHKQQTPQGVPHIVARRILSFFSWADLKYLKSRQRDSLDLHDDRDDLDIANKHKNSNSGDSKLLTSDN